MEVHAHTHTPRKKWTHYLWEFLMLFLAITLGFFVENQREHMVEHQRETEFMKSMTEDLKSDTSQITAVIRVKELRINMIDSLVFLLGAPPYAENMNAIYYFTRSVSPPLNFFPNDRTIQQLKSSGGLRLIRNVAVSNSIMAYDQKMKFQLSDIGDEENLRLEYRKSVKKLFDGKVFMTMLENNTRIERPVNDPPFFKMDTVGINDLIVDVQYVKKACQIQMIRHLELKQQATELIELIQKEYHLK